MKIFSLKFCLIFFLFTKIAVAAQEDHGKDHAQIFHAFTVEADVGEARDGRSKGFDLSGWVGGDYNRLWLKSEKKNYGNYEQKFEVQAFYSRNFSQFWDAQIGVSHDFSTDFTTQNVNYFTIGLEGLAPQFFETEAQIFLSDQGNYSARFKQEVDVLLTQRLIIQPYFETEIFAQNVSKLKVKSGISDFEIGVATRYEITRKFAPYLALRYHTKTFGTADLAKKLGERVDNFIVAAGMRLRF
ncbi:MAG TPA: copper resistance protein B [Rickettsiales bacterium]|nr:copper resistance protein B [Rickettsiales bacterium]